MSCLDEEEVAVIKEFLTILLGSFLLDGTWKLKLFCWVIVEFAVRFGFMVDELLLFKHFAVSLEDDDLF